MVQLRLSGLFLLDWLLDEGLLLVASTTLRLENRRGSGLGGFFGVVVFLVLWIALFFLNILAIYIVIKTNK